MNKKTNLLFGILLSIPTLASVGSLNKAGASSSTEVNCFSGLAISSDYLSNLENGSINFEELDEEAKDSETNTYTFYLDSDVTTDTGLVFVPNVDAETYINVYLNGHLFEGNCTAKHALSIDVTNISTDYQVHLTIYGGVKDKAFYYKESKTTNLYKFDEYGEKKFYGGTISGFTDYVYDGETSSFHDVKIYDTNFTANQALFNVGVSKNLSLFNCLLEGNYISNNSPSYSGTNLILVPSDGTDSDQSTLLLDNTVIQNNRSQEGSTIYAEKQCSVVLTNGSKVINNYSDEDSNDSSAGIYFRYDVYGCFKEGTKISLPNGSTKNIEDIVEGEEVLTFDHETGDSRSNTVFNVFKGEEKAKYFTLNFTNNISIDVVGAHGFFNKELNKYVKIDSRNAKDFIGYNFYNLIDERYETLEDVSYSTEYVDYYAFYTEYDFNAVANKMLTLEDDMFLNANIFDFGDNLVYDQVAKARDIETYGLYTPEMCSVEIDPEFFYIHKLQYIPIMVGKGLITLERLRELFYSFNPTFKPKELTKKSLGINDYLNDKVGIFLGEGVEIKDNLMHGDQYNLFLRPEGVIYVPYVHILDNVTTFDVNIRCFNQYGKFVDGINSLDYLKFFTADDENNTLTYTDNGDNTYDYFDTTGHQVTYASNIDSFTGSLPTDLTVYAPGDEVTVKTTGFSMSKDGYKFLGFALEKDATSPISSFTMPNQDVTLYAIWEVKVHTVKLSVNGVVNSINVNELNKFNLIDYLPSISRYDCLGWATSSTGEVVYKIIDELTVTQDLTLYAVLLGRTATFSGTDVSKGTSGVTSGDNSNYIEGDTYVNTSTFDYFVFKNGDWTYLGNLKGTNGSNGSNGTNGDTPFIGTNGNWWIGTTDTGVSATGPKGDKGDTGATGSNGSNGSNGTNGLDGVDGVDGKDGTNLTWVVLASATLNVALAGVVIYLLNKKKSK